MALPDAARSETMRRVHARDTSLELVFRRRLFAAGMRGWRNNRRDIPGSPDVAFANRRIAIFLDGCFWHGCPRCYRAPAANKEYWQEKVDRNRRRDFSVNALLKSQGWTVIRFWGHELDAHPGDCVARVARSLSPT